MVCLVTHSVTEIIDKWTTVYLKHYILMMCVCAYVGNVGKLLK